MTKVQYFFSFVLATISFIAARSIQQEGVKEYYQELASSFDKELGFFDLENPETVNYLPMGLQPFTAMTALDTNSMLAISHDSTALLNYNTSTNSFQFLTALPAELKFTQVACHDSTVVLLDNTQKLHFFALNSPETPFNEISLSQEESQLNLVCFHPNTKRFIFLQESATEEENKRFVLSTLRIKSKKLSETPLFQFELNALQSFVKQNQDLSLEESIEFVPVALSVHPQTNEFYILSNTGALLTMDQQGNFLSYQNLNLAQLTQPRALAFDKNGDLLISDAAVLHPVLLRVKWQKVLSEQGPLVK